MGEASSPSAGEVPGMEVKRMVHIRACALSCVACVHVARDHGYLLRRRLCVMRTRGARIRIACIRVSLRMAHLAPFARRGRWYIAHGSMSTALLAAQSTRQSL